MNKTELLSEIDDQIRNARRSIASIHRGDAGWWRVDIAEAEIKTLQDMRHLVFRLESLD